MGGEEKTLTAADLQRAEQEGIFKGQILQSLQDIKRVLDEMRDKHTQQDAKIDAKADKHEMEKISTRVDSLQRIAYIGMGILGTIEFLIAVLK